MLMKQFFAFYLKNAATLILSLFMLLFAVTKTNAQWIKLGGDSYTFKHNVTSIATDAKGNLYAAVFNDYVYEWNGAEWSALQNAKGVYVHGIINSLVTDAAGNVYAGGITGSVEKWDGTEWSALGGLYAAPFKMQAGHINSIATDVSGNVYAAGGFIDANRNRYVAKWDGTAWGELGGSNSPFNKAINSIATDAAGNVYAAGGFTDANGNPFVAKWNGTNWSELGGIGGNPFGDNVVGGGINCIAADAAGNIYAGNENAGAVGHFCVEKWNGKSWSELGGNNSFFNGSVMSIATGAAGTVYAGGNFKDANGKAFVGQWNGTAWSALGDKNTVFATGQITGVTTDNWKNVYAGGSFLIIGGNTYYIAALRKDTH